MLTAEACIQQIIEDHHNRLATSTLETYQISLRQLLSYCEKPYNEITQLDIRNWLLHLERNQYKKSSIQQKVFGLRFFFQYCVEEEIISHNPMISIPIPKVEDKLPRYLTNEQLILLRKLGEGDPKQRAVIEVLYATGVRIAELTNMKREDIHWSERMIIIPEGKGRRERIVLFTKECGEHLQAYLNIRNDTFPYLFLRREGNGPIKKRSIQHWFEKYREELGFHISPHTLRHTFAAHLALKGMPLSNIQVLLGHDTPQVTQIYARLHSHVQKQKYDEWM